MKDYSTRNEAYFLQHYFRQLGLRYEDGHVHSNNSPSRRYCIGTAIVVIGIVNELMIHKLLCMYTAAPLYYQPSGLIMLLARPVFIILLICRCYSS